MSFSTVRPGTAAVRLAASAVATLLLGVIAAPGAALAANCGDDVNGLRIACACGDNVVSDTVLAADDPVVDGSCPMDGLVVFVPKGAEGITLDLGGHSLLGRGHGVGIRVVRGGSVGSTILGGGDGLRRAEVANFRTGISAHGRNDLVEVRGIDVHDNVGDGLRLHASGVVLDDVQSESNGRDGIHLLGHGNEIRGASALRNRGDGVQVRGSAIQLEVEAADNAGHGLVVSGRSNQVTAARSIGNGGRGLVTSGAGHHVDELQSIGNKGGDEPATAGASAGASR